MCILDTLYGVHVYREIPKLRQKLDYDIKNQLEHYRSEQ